MRINGQAGWLTYGWTTLLALAVCLTGAPLFAADLSNPVTRGDRARPLAAIEIAPGPYAATRGLQAAEQPGTQRAFLVRLETRSKGFIGRHLAPRLAHQMVQVAPIQALEIDRTRFERSELHNWFSGTAGHYAERGARKAVRDYLLEETGLGAFVQSMRVGHGSGPDRPIDERSTDFGVKIAHGRPQLEMAHRSAAGTTRLRVDLDGFVSVEFRSARAPAARLVAGYDLSSSDFGVVFRHSF